MKWICCVAAGLLALRALAVETPASEVVEAWFLDSEMARKTDTPAGRLNETLVVKVTNLEGTRYLEETNRRPLALFLNWMEVTNVTAESAHRTTNGMVQMQFRLHRTEANKSVWGTLFRMPFPHGLPPVKPVIRAVDVSVGPPRGVPFESKVTVELEIFRWRGWVIFWALLILVVLLLIVKFRDILRDPSPPGSSVKPAYSLARVQAVWWFFVILISYVLIWIITNDMSTLTGSTLTLLGISAGTYLAASMGDEGSKTPPTASSGGRLSILRDILREDQGVSFHRLQMLIWTGVISIMFLVAAWNELAMPELSATLLGLMGISAGTYLGFKFPRDTTINSTATLPGGVPPLTKPIGKALGGGRVYVKSDPIPSAETYQFWVQGATDAQFSQLVTSPNPDKILSGLTANTTVKIKMCAVKQGVVGPFSEEVSVLVA